MIDRRVFIGALAGGALAVSRGAAGQATTGHRIGWLSAARSGSFPAAFEAFRQGLRDLGYVEGRNLMLDARWADDSDERVLPLAVELLHERPQVVVAQGPAVYAFVQAKASLPVVFAFSGDPVVAKLVDSLARPGRNFTGMSFLSLELVGKRMEILAETLPGLKRIAILANPQHAGVQSELAASKAAAQRLALAFDYFEARSPTEFDDAFATAAKAGCQAAVVFPDARMMRNAERIAGLAERHRIPAVSGWGEFAQRGNLLSYGPKLSDAFRRLATYVDRILKGAKPGDLPVELPDRLELVVNLKAAKALGVAVPRSVELRADEVIR